MDDADSLPTDLTECHRLLLAAFKQTVQLERRAHNSEQRAAASEQRVAELDRVLDATSASYQELQQEHTSTLEELAWYKRWVQGRFWKQPRPPTDQGGKRRRAVDGNETTSIRTLSTTSR